MKFDWRLCSSPDVTLVNAKSDRKFVYYIGGLTVSIYIHGQFTHHQIDMEELK